MPHNWCRPKHEYTKTRPRFAPGLWLGESIVCAGRSDRGAVFPGALAAGDGTRYLIRPSATFSPVEAEKGIPPRPRVDSLASCLVGLRPFALRNGLVHSRSLGPSGFCPTLLDKLLSAFPKRRKSFHAFPTRSNPRPARPPRPPPTNQQKSCWRESEPSNIGIYARRQTIRPPSNALRIPAT